MRNWQLPTQLVGMTERVRPMRFDEVEELITSRPLVFYDRLMERGQINRPRSTAQLEVPANHCKADLVRQQDLSLYADETAR